VANDIRAATSTEHALKMVDDKVERLARTPGSGPRGPVKPPSLAPALVVVTPTETVNTEAVTFTAVKDRLYKVTRLSNEAIASGGPVLVTNFRVANASSVTTSSPIIWQFVGAPGSSFRTETRVCWWIATFTGQATIGVTCVTTATTTAQMDSRNLLVEDAGLPSS